MSIAETLKSRYCNDSNTIKQQTFKSQKGLICRWRWDLSNKHIWFRKKNPSQDLREVRLDTKSKPRIDYSTPIEIFICELQKVKPENQDTMEYEAYVNWKHKCKVLDRLTKTSRKKTMESIVAGASSINLTNPTRPSIM